MQRKLKRIKLEIPSASARVEFQKQILMGRSAVTTEVTIEA